MTLKILVREWLLQARRNQMYLAERKVIPINLLIVLKKGKVIAVVCCANGTDSSHTLAKGKDYSILDVDKLNLEAPDWLAPKVFHHSDEHDEEF